MRHFRDFAAGLLRGAIRFYQLFVSPIFPASCRFAPSCSHYAMEAIGRHGPLRGLGLAVRRIARCHPWGGQGFDPVPEPVERARRGARGTQRSARF